MPLSRQMLRACLVMCCMCVGAHPLRAEARIGLSAFGIFSENFQGRPCSILLETIRHSDRPAIAALYKTFGTNTACIERFWRKTSEWGKTHVTEIHFSNEAGRRSGLLDKDDFVRSADVETYTSLLEAMPEWLDAAIRERTREIVALIQPGLSNGSFILSTGLEDNFSNLAWDNIYAIIRQEWPYEIVRSPALSAYIVEQQFVPPAGIRMESHGYSRRLDQQGCIGNGDGQDLDFLQNAGRNFRNAKAATMRSVKNWIRRGVRNDCILFLWAGKWQGFFQDGDRASAPLKREFVMHRNDIPVIRELFRMLVHVERRMKKEATSGAVGQTFLKREKK